MIGRHRTRKQKLARHLAKFSDRRRQSNQIAAALKPEIQELKLDLQQTEDRYKQALQKVGHRRDIGRITDSVGQRVGRVEGSSPVEAARRFYNLGSAAKRALKKVGTAVKRQLQPREPDRGR